METDKAGYVDVWVADLRLHGGFRAHAVLDQGELARASRFVSTELATRWASARAFLRLVLALHTRRDPASLAFTATCGRCGGPHGKPRLVGEAELEFSLSHSEHLVACAVSRDAVGLDLEVRRPEVELAPEFCTARELDAVAGTSDPEALLRRLWARKEACGKSTGLGLMATLSAIDCLDVEWDRWRRCVSPESGPCWIRDLPIADDAAMALATPVAGGLGVRRRAFGDLLGTAVAV